METALERNNPRVARKTIRIPQLERLKSNRNEKILIHRQVSRHSSLNVDAVFKEMSGHIPVTFLRLRQRQDSLLSVQVRETDTIAIAVVVHYN